MKRTPINKVSNKHAKELIKRSKLKAELIQEHGNHCMTCNDDNKDWRGLTLSHIKALSLGGLTEKSNCILECFPCHERRQQYYGQNNKTLPNP
jgi:hypothetical protein